MKRLLFLCLLLTAFSCKPAAIDEIYQGGEQITIISNGTEFQISKEIALKFSQTIKDMYKVKKDISKFIYEANPNTSIFSEFDHDFRLEMRKTIKALNALNHRFSPISFGPDLVRPEILKQMLLVLEQANNILIESPTSSDGSYRQL